MQQSQVVENTSFCSADKPNLSERKKDADIQYFGWFHCLSKALLSVILKDLIITSAKPAPVGNGNAPFVLVSWKWGILLEMEMK